MRPNPRLARPVRRPLALGVAFAAALGAAHPARAEAVLYRTPDGQEGIVSDPALVPPGATIVTERKRTLIRLPADEIGGSVLGPGGAEGAASASPDAGRDAASAASNDGAWNDSLPPLPPEARRSGAGPTGADSELDLGDDDLEATDPTLLARPGGTRAPAARSGDALPLPGRTPEERRAAEIAHRERCENLGLFGYSCTPSAMAEAERWGALARAAREERELGEARVVHLRERYAHCESARRSAICPKRELDAAERRLAELERREEQIEDACRAADCLPGWLRL